LIDPRLVKQLALTEEGAASIIGIMSLPIQVPLVSLSRVSYGAASSETLQGWHCRPNKSPYWYSVDSWNQRIYWLSIFQKGDFISCDSELDNSQKSARGRFWPLTVDNFDGVFWKE
jgi:hypothetical protein